MKHFALCLLAAALLLAGCKKETKPGNLPTDPNTPNFPLTPITTYSFANTEWTGVAETYGWIFPQPMYLKFNGDTAVTVYALFHWYEGQTFVENDSLNGTITSVDTVTYGWTTITVNFAKTNDQQIYRIMNKNTLSGGSLNSAAAINKQYTLNLNLCTGAAPDVSGTNWDTDVVPGSTGVYQPHWYPDLETFSFKTNGTTSYTRNGVGVTIVGVTQYQELTFPYTQKGWRLFFAGYNEEKQVLLVYFGVLTPDGMTIVADTRETGVARLPSYTQINPIYGEAGATPLVHKVQ